MDDDLGGSAGVPVETRCGDFGVVEEGEGLGLRVVGVEEELGPNLFRGGREHVEVVEGPFVPKAAQLGPVTDHLLISLYPATRRGKRRE